MEMLFTMTSNKMSDKLQKLQTRALRICTKSRMDMPMAILYRSTNTVSLEKRRLAHVYNFMYKQTYNVHRKIYTRRRDAPILHVKRPKCEKYKKNVFYYGANLWNDLPVKTRKIETCEKFKTFQKKQMLL